MTPREELDHLKVGITNFSYAVDECNIVQTNHQSINIGDALHALGYGSKLVEENHKEEYRLLFNEFTKVKDKLYKCDCEKKD